VHRDRPRCGARTRAGGICQVRAEPKGARKAVPAYRSFRDVGGARNEPASHQLSWHRLTLSQGGPWCVFLERGYTASERAGNELSESRTGGSASHGISANLCAGGPRKCARIAEAQPRLARLSGQSVHQSSWRLSARANRFVLTQRSPLTLLLDRQLPPRG
jgi:hypothetical protein